MVSRHIARSVLVTSLALTACPGSPTGPSVDAGLEFPVTLEWRFPDTFRPTPDTFVGEPDMLGPCEEFKSEGQSCAGGQSCPTGQQPMTMPDGACRCRISCNPTKQDQCGESCGYECVQLTDQQNKPIPGIGACLRDEHAVQGESCSPGICQKQYVCVGDTTAVSFCRNTCTGPQDCLGYKMVCIKLQNTTTKVCIPGGSVTGPKLGQACQGAEEFCAEGGICDPLFQICVRPCNTDEGSADPCGGGKSCVELKDPGTQVVLGFGCR